MAFDNPPEGWEVLVGTWGDDIEREETITANGEFSILFDGELSAAAPAIIGDMVPVDPLLPYTIQAMIRTTDKTDGYQMAIRWYGADETYISESSIGTEPLEANDTWQVVSRGVNPVSTAAFARLVFRVTHGNASFYYLASYSLTQCQPYFDHILTSDQTLTTGGWRNIVYTDTVSVGCDLDSGSSIYGVDFRGRRLPVMLNAVAKVLTIPTTRFAQLRLYEHSQSLPIAYGPKIYNHTGGNDDLWVSVNFVYRLSHLDRKIGVQIYHDSGGDRTLDKADADSTVVTRFAGSAFTL